MAGLDTRGAFDGFQKGFGMVDNYYARQDMQKRADQQSENQQKLVDAKLDETRKANQKELVSQYYTAVANGVDVPISDDLKQAFKDNPMVDPAHLFDNKTEAAINYAVGLKDGKGDMFGKETAEQMNNFFGPRVGRGDGLPEGAAKSIAGVFPGQQPGTMAFDLNIKHQDGTERNAPMTVNRSTSDDDHVAQYPIEEVIKPVLGAKQILDSISPEKRAIAIKYLQDSGWMKKTSSSTVIQGPDGSLFSIDENGVPKLLLGREKTDNSKPTDLAQFRELAAEMGPEKAAQYMAMAKGKGLTSTSGGGGVKGGTWGEVQTDNDGSQYQDNDMTGARKFIKNSTSAKSAASAKPARLSNTAQNAEDKDIEGVGDLRAVNNSMQNILDDLNSGKLKPGPVSNAISRGRNYLGLSSEDSEAYAAMNSSILEAVNNSLHLNKGTQTDKDFANAKNALLSNLNSPSVIKERLSEMIEINKTAMDLRQAKISQRRKNFGVEDLSVKSILDPSESESSVPGLQALKTQAPTKTGGAQAATADQLHKSGMPALPKSRADYDALPSGTQYISKDGQVKVKG